MDTSLLDEEIEDVGHYHPPPKKRSDRTTNCLIATAIVLLTITLLLTSALIILLVTRKSTSSTSPETNTQSSNPALNTVPAQRTINGSVVEIGKGTYSTNQTNQTVFLVLNGGTLKITAGAIINKTGSPQSVDDNDEINFDGSNAAILVSGSSSSAQIKGATIVTDALASAALVATLNGEITISDSSITTNSNNSRGIQCTYGGKLTVSNTTIITYGYLSPALAVERGGGTIEAKKMTLTTSAKLSALVYSAGSITITSSTGKAYSQIATVEGKNRINMTKCNFTCDAWGKVKNVDDCAVMLYDDGEKDESSGMGSFYATNCNLVLNPSSFIYEITPFFFFTNTDGYLELSSSNFTLNQYYFFLFAVATDLYGESGSNGATVTWCSENIVSPTFRTYADSSSSIDESTISVIQPIPSPLPSSGVLITVPTISQHTAFPTGCESISAVMLLHYFDVLVPPLYFTSNFLTKAPYSSHPYPDAFFVGEPTDGNSFGCFARPIAAAVNKAFNADPSVFYNDSSSSSSSSASNAASTLVAKPVQNISLTKLCEEYVKKKNRPVLVWVTMNMRPTIQGATWTIEKVDDATAEWKGKTFVWPGREHCVVLVGYDDDYYYVNDPYQRDLSRVRGAFPRDVFEERYKEQAMRAVVIEDA